MEKHNDELRSIIICETDNEYYYCEYHVTMNNDIIDQCGHAGEAKEQ